MGWLRDIRYAIKLQKGFRDLQESFASTQNLVRDLEAEVNRLRMQWADHLELTEKVVGRWSKREQIEKKKRKQEPEDDQYDLDELIKSGRLNLGSDRYAR